MSDQVFTLRRNPYFVGVDPDGNQLPYLDEVRFTFFADIQALNLAAIAGEMDMQERHIQMTNYPVFKENEKSGKYRVITWPTFGGADAVVAFNTVLQGRPGARQAAREQGLPGRALPCHQPRPDQGVGLPRSRRAAPGRAGPLAPVLPGRRVGEEVHAVQAGRGQQAPRRHRPRQEGRPGHPAPAEWQAPVDRALGRARLRRVARRRPARSRRTGRRSASRPSSSSASGRSTSRCATPTSSRRRCGTRTPPPSRSPATPRWTSGTTRS